MSEQAKSCIALGTLQNFREGWAIVPFMGKPHYWVECQPDAIHAWEMRGRVYRSACGVYACTVMDQRPIVPGNFPKCKRCQRSVKVRPE